MLLLSALAIAGPRLPEGVSVVHQDVRLTIDPAKAEMPGSTSIRIRLDAPADRIVLHAQEMEVTRAEVLVRRRRIPATVDVLEFGQIAVVPKTPLRPGEYTLRLDFANDVNTAPYGIFKYEHDEQPFVVSQMEADDARTAFPCFDEPSFKHPWTFTITAPEGHHVITNAPVVEQSTREGSTTHTFAATPPIPSYAVAVAVGPFARVEVPDGMGAIYTPPGTEELTGVVAAAVRPTLDDIEGWFGTPYPYAKLDWVIASGFPYGGMENPGAVVLADNVLLGPGATGKQKARARHVVAHEIAHMWFGDLVTLAWWDDFWLNESFAEWMALRSTQAVFPEARPTLRKVMNASGAMQSDGRATMRPVRTEIDPVAIFESANFLAYPKGQAVLSMVQGWIGEDDFQRGLQTYMDRHAWGNATAADLFTALQETSGEPVADVLTPFLDQPGIPLMKLAKDGDVVTVGQERYAVVGAELEAASWPVPMVWKVGRGDTIDTQAVFFDGEGNQTVELGEHDWVLPTADARGYLVWEQDAEATKALLQAFPKLTPAERMAVLGNLDSLVSAGRLDGGELLELLATVKDTDPLVVKRIVSFLAMPDDVTEAGDPRFAAYVKDTIGPALDAIGIDPVDGEPVDNAWLRSTLVKWLGEVGDEDVLAWADTTADAFLADPASVDAALGSLALQLKARNSDAEMYDRLLGVWGNPEVPPSIRSSALQAASMVPDKQDDVLALALSDGTQLGDMWAIFSGVGAYDEDSDVMLDWAIANEPAIAAKLPPQFRGGMVRFGSGCDLERFERAKAFFGAPERKVKGTDRSIGEVEESVRTCVAFRERHRASIEGFLKTEYTAAP